MPSTSVKAQIYYKVLLKASNQIRLWISNQHRKQDFFFSSDITMLGTVGGEQVFSTLDEDITCCFKSPNQDQNRAYERLLF